MFTHSIDVKIKMIILVCNMFQIPCDKLGVIERLEAYIHSIYKESILKIIPDALFIDIYPSLP